MNAETFAADVVDRPLRLRRRLDLQIRKMEFGTQSCWVVKDPVTLDYFHLTEEEHFVLQQLDGRNSFAKIRENFERNFAPRRVTVLRLESFFATLHKQNLVVAETAGQGSRMWKRLRRRQRHARISRISNLLAIRFSGFDPDRLLNLLAPRCHWLFSRWTLGCGLMLIGAALVLVGVQWETLQARLPELTVFFSVTNVLWILCTLAVAKSLHELGHALACKYYGGECHEMGLMLLVFTPCLYCNVSDAWLLPNKWHRIVISAAGLFVELVLAAGCTFLWWFSTPGLLNALCLNTMIVCSIGSLLFNGNPLLKYDAYYVLADLTETPNLWQQSRTVLGNALSSWLLGIQPAIQRWIPQRSRVFLAGYGVASIAYRLCVVTLILLFINETLKAHRLQIVGQMLAATVVAGFLVPPLVNTLTLFRDPFWRKCVMWKRLTIRGGLLLGAVCTGLLVPFPYSIEAPATIEPSNAERVYVAVPGTLNSLVQVGDSVESGQPLARLENLDLEREFRNLAAQVRRQQLLLRNLHRRQVADPIVATQIPSAEERLADLESRLAQRQEDRKRLTLTATVSGLILPPRQRLERTPPGELSVWSGSPLDESNQGSFQEAGTTFCLVGDPGQIEAVLFLEQADIDLVQVHQSVEVRLDHRPGEFFAGTVKEISESNLESPAVSRAAQLGVAVQSVTDDLNRPVKTTYLVRVAFGQATGALLLDATGRARIHVPPRSLVRRLGRFLARTFRFAI